ncbi:MAG: carboxypeptidase-like regulatory domain-containing protein [Candidatus Bathyarchaeia archaeon]
MPTQKKNPMAYKTKIIILFFSVHVIFNFGYCKGLEGPSQSQNNIKLNDTQNSSDISKLERNETNSDRDITLTIKGMIKDANNSSQVVGAAVDLMETVGSAARVLAETRSDSEGRYTIKFTLSDCCEKTLFLNIYADGYLPQQILPDNDPHIKCTQNVQTINVTCHPEV